MKYSSRRPLPDIQISRDFRGFPIDKVGVCDLSFPIVVLDRQNQRQQTVAKISMSVNLPRHLKGTHMSRFIEILSSHQSEITIHSIGPILHALKKRLDSKAAQIEMDFPFFITRAAPVSGFQAPMDYRCTFIGESNGGNDEFRLRVAVPVTTVCPCSKEISDYGAHNQRGLVVITVKPRRKNGCWQSIWIEELISIAERSASAPVYSLLKRPDERHVTMQAFDNPVFVEDVVRNAASLLAKDERINWFEVRAVNQESIHNHSAFAVVSSAQRVEDHVSPRIQQEEIHYGYENEKRNGNHFNEPHRIQGYENGLDAVLPERSNYARCRGGE
jgi:GTP cyclohydrolase I